MKTGQTPKLIIFFLALALSAGFAGAVGQQAPPTGNKGVTVKELAAVELGPAIAGMQGRNLRMRMLTLEPGGVFGVHSQIDRPLTAYMMHGKVTEHRGSIVREYGPGESWSETTETVHWLENRGNTPAVAIIAEIFKQP